MKPIIMLTAVLFSVLAQAQAINYKSVPLCSYWTYNNGTYSCSSYPMTEYVPDRFSLDNKIRQLEQRIAALEAKLQQYETEKQ